MWKSGKVLSCLKVTSSFCYKQWNLVPDLGYVGMQNKGHMIHNSQNYKKERLAVFCYVTNEKIFEFFKAILLFLSTM